MAQVTHDVCLTSAQCLHGGRCIRPSEHLVVREPGQYNYCECADRFAGLRCESFCPLECQNGGVCFSDDSSKKTSKSSTSSEYSCKCLGHWTGTTCDQAYENCGNGVQCFNGGACVLAGASGDGDDTKANDYYCDCPEGYGGPTCRDPKELIVTTSRWGMLGDFLIDSETGTILLGSGALILVVVAVTVLVAQYVKRRREKYSAVVSDEDSDRALKEYECSSSIRSQAERWRNII